MTKPTPAVILPSPILCLIPFLAACAGRSPTPTKPQAPPLARADSAGSEGGAVPAAAAIPVPAADVPTTATPRLSQEELDRLGSEICDQIAGVRAREFLRPVGMKLAGQQQFLEYAEERLRQTTTPERLAGEELAAKLLGLIPPEMDLLATLLDLLEGQVGGFYDPADDSFCVMDSFTGGIARVIMAHELTHALDDQLFDLDGGIAARLTEADAAFAYQALCEGSATSVMNRWVLENLGSISPQDLAQAQSMDVAGLEAAPEYVWKPLLGAYLRGSAFLARTENVMEGQRALVPPEDFERAFRDPPRSSEQILHPEKYWDAALLDEPLAVGIDCSGLPEGWTQVHGDTLGELGLALVVNPPRLRKPIDAKNAMSILGLRYTSQAASGWGGDRYVILAKDAARVLVLASAWDSESDAQEFEDALQGVAAHLESGAQALGGSSGIASVVIERGDGAQVRLRVASGVTAEVAAEVAGAIAIDWPIDRRAASATSSGD